MATNGDADHAAKKFTGLLGDRLKPELGITIHGAVVGNGD